MKLLFRVFACCALLALLALCAGQLCQAQQAPKPKKQPTADDIAKVEAAAPAEAPAKPKQPRKVLVFNRTRGFYHDSIPLGAKAMEILGKKTGAFETTISDNPAMFAADTLQGFDAVIMNNTTGRTPELFFGPENYDQLNAEQKAAADKQSAQYGENLINFIKSGKGIVGIHAATDCCYTWADYGEMMGGFFNGHPWHTKVPVKVDLPDHVINKPFGGKTFEVFDEIYIFKEPYTREKLLVLLSLDTPNLPQTPASAKKHREDGDYAVSWVHKFGQGRVFYCSLGHDWPIFWTPAILDHYLRGIQYVLGDLAADDTPQPARK